MTPEEKLMKDAEEASQIFQRQAEEAIAEMEKTIPDMEGVEL